MLDSVNYTQCQHRLTSFDCGLQFEDLYIKGDFQVSNGEGQEQASAGKSARRRVWRMVRAVRAGSHGQGKKVKVRMTSMRVYREDSGGLHRYHKHQRDE
jgi:hypothetical protein